MPKDPKRNLQNYQIQGGHLNEFEYQKDQGEMAEESKPLFTIETDPPKITEADRIAAVTAEAHRKVQKRNKGGTKKAAAPRRTAAVGRTSRKATKKVARKPAKKVAVRTGAKKRGQRVAAGKKSAKKPARRAATKSAKKTAKRAATKKRASVKR